jgi:hypothetical protein
MGTVLWALVVILGIRLALSSLGHYRRKRAELAAERMEHPQFSVLAFSELPRWVVARMSPLRDGFLALGFRDFVCYTRRSTRTNFSCVLQSPDHDTNVFIWVAQNGGLMYWLMLLNSWRVFIRNARAEARYSLTTEFPEARRFDTTPIEILANATVPGQLEFLIVPERTSLEEAVRRHDEAARAFAAKHGLEVLRVTTQEAFFDLERTLMARTARKLRRGLATP